MDTKEIQNLIKEILEKATISVERVVFNENKPASFGGDPTKIMWFSAEIGQPHLFCDRNGEGLSALNHIIKRILENNNKTKEIDQIEPSVLIDINGFQKKRIEGVHALTHMMAERARYFKSNIEMDPMSAFERRIVHEFLADAIDLKTESEGEGKNRKVIIKYIGSI